MIKQNHVSFWVSFLGLFVATFNLPWDFLILSARQLDSLFFVPEARDLEYNPVNLFFWQLAGSYFVPAVLLVIANMRGWDENNVKPIRAFRKGYLQAYFNIHKYSSMDGCGEKIGFRYAQVVCPVGAFIAVVVGVVIWIVFILMFFLIVRAIII